MDYASQAPRYMRLASAESTVEGPTAVMTQRYTLGEYTTLTQRVILVAGSRRLDFQTVAHWREPQAMLRTSFPVAVQAEAATFEIQFGALQRSTHTNTTWDLAKSEVPAQKWADLSQRDYGVALLNDCKYGYKVKRNVLDLNLLRSVPYPRQPLEPTDAEREAGAPRFGFTDQCDHAFTYSLFPHPGDHVEGGVAHEAYQLNAPLSPTWTPADVRGGGAGEVTVAGLCVVGAAQVIVEAVKAVRAHPSWSPMVVHHGLRW
jgi:alpha-mannosidase